MGLAVSSAGFLAWLDQFMAGLPPRPMADIARAAGGGDRVAVISVDLICGFAKEGPLASPRVDATLPAVVRTLRAAAAAGAREACLLQDAHPEDAVEFAHFGPHCVRGSGEAAAVPELAEFFRGSPMRATVIEKNSISGYHAPGFQEWYDRVRADGVNTFIVVGDCTDLCVTHIVMPLRTLANQENRDVRLILPEDCLQTYDLPVETAQRLGIMPHDGDLLHAVYLYNMAQNGAEVVRSVT